MGPTCPIPYVRPKAVLKLRKDQIHDRLEHGVEYEFRNKSDHMGGGLFMVWDHLCDKPEWVCFDWDNEIIDLYFEITFK